jgi:putative acyl-CoA dehydrogenase
MQKTPAVVAAFFAELGKARGLSADLDRWVAQLQTELHDWSELEYRARDVVDQMALAIQAALLLQHAPAAVSQGFCASRLGRGGLRNTGALPRGVDCAALIARAAPLR